MEASRAWPGSYWKATGCWSRCGRMRIRSSSRCTPRSRSPIRPGSDGGTVRVADDGSVLWRGCVQTLPGDDARSIPPRLPISSFRRFLGWTTWVRSRRAARRPRATDVAVCAGARATRPRHAIRPSLTSMAVLRPLAKRPSTTESAVVVNDAAATRLAQAPGLERCTSVRSKLASAGRCPGLTDPE